MAITKLTRKYWIEKGYSNEEASEIVKKESFKCKYLKGKKDNETEEQFRIRMKNEAIMRNKNCKSYWVLNYGEIEGLEKWDRYKNSKDFKEKNSTNFDYWLKKHNGDEEKAKEAYKSRQKTICKENFIKKYGFEFGKQKWDEYRLKYTKEEIIKKIGKEKWQQISKKKSNTLESFIKRHGIEDGNKKFDDYVSNCRRDKKFFIKKYGENDGNKKYKEYKQKLKDNSSCNINYWVKKGFSEEDAKRKLKERQTTFNKEICIEKYGKEDGLKRWKERQEKWIKTLNEKSDKEKKTINRKRIEFSNNTSSIAESFFDDLVSEIKKMYPYYNEEISYSRSNEWFIYDEETKKYFLYDFKVKNKIIEFNGDFWHCNPKKFEENYYHRVIKKTAKEIWDKDDYKIMKAIDKGFDVLIIWEDDVKQDKKQIIKECLEFIFKEII